MEGKTKSLKRSLAYLYSSCLFFLRIGAFRYVKYYRFLRQSQWWSRWKLEQYQIKRLKQLLIYAYNNVPYYTEIFKKYNLQPGDFNSIKDLQKLPILSKEDVVKNFDKLVSKRVNRKHLELITTSGTTGKLMQFYYYVSEKSYNLAIRRRQEVWASLKNARLNAQKNKRGVNLWARPFIKRGIKGISIYDRYRNILALSATPHSPAILGRYIEIIRQFNPFYIQGNPSMLYRLACYAQENNINDIRFHSFISMHENLFLHQREKIKNQFQCQIYNHYALMELPLVAFECPSHEGMHIEMESVILEVLDEKGTVLPPGHLGRIVLTGLNNRAMPFIRYDTGDMGSILEKPCSCGRGLLLLRSLEGRRNETLKYKGKIVYSATLACQLWKVKNIKECQFTQENENEIGVNIVKRDCFSEDDAKELVESLRNLIDKELEVKLNFVDYIPRTRMGKFPFIISNVKN